MALSTAPTGEIVEVLEAAEVSELVLGATASLHHGAGGRVPTAEADLKTEITDNEQLTLSVCNFPAASIFPPPANLAELDTSLQNSQPHNLNTHFPHLGWGESEIFIKVKHI